MIYQNIMTKQQIDDLKIGDEIFDTYIQKYCNVKRKNILNTTLDVKDCIFGMVVDNEYLSLFCKKE